MHRGNPYLTPVLPLFAVSLETQRAQRKANIIMTRILRLPNSGHTPAPPAQLNLFSATRRAGCLSRILISPILLKVMWVPSAFSAALRSASDWARDKYFLRTLSSQLLADLFDQISFSLQLAAMSYELSAILEVDMLRSLNRVFAMSFQL